MKLSPITKDQFLKIAKAFAYSFVSTFVISLMAQPTLDKAALYAAAVAGFNAALVTVKQAFTDGQAN